MTRQPIALLSLLLILVAVPVAAAVVSGQVTSTGGTGIANVDLDFIDRNTDQSIALVNDNTDVLGFFAVSVPNGDYDVRFKPPAGASFVAAEERNVRVEGSSQTLNQVLANGWFVTGRVLDENGAPINPLDLDVIEAGNALFVANDRTDAFGIFSIVLPTGVFDIQFEPPVGTPYVPLQMGGVAVNTTSPLGDVTLLFGVRLSGAVVDSSLLPVGQVQVQTIDPTTGLEIFNIRNVTDAAGAYSLRVAAGDLGLQLIPPRGSAALPRYVGGVSVSADTTLPDIALDVGALITGLIIDGSGDPVEAVDLDFVSSWSGIKRFTPKDNSDVDGLFAIAVAAGTYDIRFDPPPATGLAPAQLTGVQLSSSTALPTVQLQDAVTVSGEVRDGANVPQPGLDLDFLAPASQDELPSSQDTTDAFGAFATAVNPGSYDVRVNPTPGSGLGQLVVPSVIVNSNVNLGTLTLPAAGTATVAGLSPTSGPATGGTLVTVTGTGFSDGVTVRLGGTPLSSVVVLNSTTIEGLTPVHPVGTVVAEVLLPGSTPLSSPGGFTFSAVALDPVLTVRKHGPLQTDLLLEWSDTGRPFYTVFRGVAPSTGTPTVHDATATLSLRIDAGAVSGPAAYFLVH